MTVFRDVAAILFDSGDTLVRPIGGEWLPGPIFRRIVAEAGVDADWTQLARGHEAGTLQLLANHLLTSEDEEIERYAAYCAALLDALGLGNAGLDAHEIARQIVTTIGIEPFLDARPALERLRAQKLTLGVISNGWPSLDRQLQAVDLRHYFDLLIVSAHVGSRKPETRIFDYALEQLGMDAGNVLLVDDAPENIVAAHALGMQGVVVARTGAPPTELPWVRSLAELDVLPIP
jgi:HAD superfamily hydrolase (TIGR01509 family)